MHHFITGIAGFIGSHLADSLLADGAFVTGLDDFSLGRREHLNSAHGNDRFLFIEGDCTDTGTVFESLRTASKRTTPPDMVWHLAANSDIALGIAETDIDLRKTLLTTVAVLDACRVADIRRIAFASTSAVYGERDDLLTEDSGPLLPISNYGAAKLASEAFLSAAAEAFLETIWIFRFPNVVGSRATHGAIFDFVSRLLSGPSALTVLGDGSQRKPYLHVAELIAAMKFIVANAAERRNVFNIGPSGAGTKVSFLAEQVIARVAPDTLISYAGGDRGWIGDVPRFRYSTERLAQLGWEPKLTSDEAVLRAIDEIVTATTGL